MLDLVVLGNLIVDDIVYEDGTTRMAQPGGAVLYFALGAHVSGLRVGVVSWRGDDYPAATLDALSERGIDLEGVHHLGQPGLRTWLLYEGKVRHVVHRLQGPSHAEVSPTVERIPPSWLSSRAFHLAPMPLPIQGDLVTALRERSSAHISLDPYELLHDRDLGIWQKLLGGVDTFFLSEDEMMVTGESRDALVELAGEGRQVVYKQGARGGVVCEGRIDGPPRFVEWQARASRFVDPTGAGDAFAAGFLAGKLRGEGLEGTLDRAVAAASCAIEGQGIEGLLAAQPPLPITRSGAG